MKSRSLLLLATAVTAIIAVSAVQAQDNYFTRDNAYEIEAGAGPNFGIANVEAMKKNKVGIDYYGEARYNFARVPLALGVQVAYNIVERSTYGYTMSGDYGTVTSHSTFDYNSTSVMLTCDYRKRVSKCVTLFGGIGLGYCHIDTSNDLERAGGDINGENFTDNGTSGSVAFMPRVGVHIGNLARITAGYKLQERANRHAFVTLGLTFGFKPRR